MSNTTDLTADFEAISTESLAADFKLPTITHKKAQFLVTDEITDVTTSIPTYWERLAVSIDNMPTVEANIPEQVALDPAYRRRYHSESLPSSSNPGMSKVRSAVAGYERIGRMRAEIDSTDRPRNKLRQTTRLRTYSEGTAGTRTTKWRGRQTDPLETDAQQVLSFTGLQT